MHEFAKLLAVYEKVDFNQRKAALATVMNVRGSSYRRPGARMLMTDDGRWTGAISGGCLEGDALRQARQAILLGKPSVVTYNTMDDREASALGIGLGCNGIIDVLIEPIDPTQADNPMEMLRTALRNREVSVLATVFSVDYFTQSLDAPIRIGDRLVREAGGNVRNTIAHSRLAARVRKEVNKSFKTEKPSVQTYTTAEFSVEVFIEVIRPSIHLVVFGGGYDAVPVTRLAKNIDWHVTVTDDCVAHLSPKRFPDADAVVHALRSSITEQLPLNRYTAAVLMSHNFAYDLAVLRELVKTDVPYIGILGPQKRGAKLLEELEKEGIHLTPKQRKRLHNPIGLDIGAETPEEIALSILAEVQATFARAKGGSLRKKNGPIHHRPEVRTEPSDYSSPPACAISVYADEL